MIMSDIFVNLICLLFNSIVSICWALDRIEANGSFWQRPERYGWAVILWFFSLSNIPWELELLVPGIPRSIVRRFLATTRRIAEFSSRRIPTDDDKIVYVGGDFDMFNVIILVIILRPFVSRTNFRRKNSLNNSCRRGDKRRQELYTWKTTMETFWLLRLVTALSGRHLSSLACAWGLWVVDFQISARRMCQACLNHCKLSSK